MNIFLSLTLIWSAAAALSASLEDPIYSNHVIDNVLKTLKNFENETMRRNHELFCVKHYYKEDLAKGYDGCSSHVVEKAYCQGQCSSVYLPGHGSGALSCSSCGIKKRKTKTVKLSCHSGIRRVKYDIVEECACKPCKVKNEIPEPPWKRYSKEELRAERKKTMKMKAKLREKRRNMSKKLKSQNINIKRRNKNKNKLNKRNRSKPKSKWRSRSRRPSRNKTRTRRKGRRKNRTQRKHRFTIKLRSAADKERDNKNNILKQKKKTFTYNDLIKFMFSWT